VQTDKFFDKLKADGHNVNAYVIMPDHVHAILSFTYTEKRINRILGDGKKIYHL
jgi:REP element-mobilizing transposase RayT